MRRGLSGRFATCAMAAAAGWLLMSGCDKNSDNPLSHGTSEAKNPSVPALTVEPRPAPSNALLPFKDAVLFEPPEGEQRPPDKTVAGKNVGRLFEEIAGQEGAAGLWDKIALTGPDGRAIRYTAYVKTDLGTIEIELYSESAPNQVRNFIALARAGYFNGLPFHRSISKESLAYLEGGCPLGTGDIGFGSIGYWLRPEISPTLTHDDGTVGAVHGEAMDSAACKFYVSLAKAPGMDGSYTIFGKITKGLDIAHAINKRPVVDDGDLNDRPKEPVIIREVIIK